MSRIAEQLNEQMMLWLVKLAAFSNSLTARKWNGVEIVGAVGDHLEVIDALEWLSAATPTLAHAIQHRIRTVFCLRGQWKAGLVLPRHGVLTTNMADGARERLASRISAASQYIAECVDSGVFSIREV